jgi:hypothetical protein
MKARAKKRRISGPSRFKLRTCRGNQHTNKAAEQSDSSVVDINIGNNLDSLDDTGVINQHDSSSSSSRRKLDSSLNVSDNDNSVLEDDSSHYILMNSDILQGMISLIGCCPKCNSRGLTFENDYKKKKGLANYLSLSCSNCKWGHSTYTSKDIPKPTPGVNAFDVNVRSVVAFREIGKGLSDMKKLCGYMNMVPPMQTTAFYNIQKEVVGSYRSVVEASMQRAAHEIKETSSDIAVSCDGAWQKRGYSSLNGFVTVISVDSGKCLDFRVKTKKCTACSIWERRKDTDEYKSFIETHVCPINHEGSAGAMEPEALVEIFTASENFNGLRYVKFLGDGDTKSHRDVVAADPYPGTVVVKLECIGHVQKRVGSRLRTLKTSYKGRKDVDGVAVKKLTHKQINKLQNYYGIAVRQYKGDSVYEMKKCIGAVLYHCSEADSDEQQHEMCPRGPDSWCKYQLDIANQTSLYKKSKTLLPKAVKKIIKPIFMSLSDNELLEKCMHGKTQNNNEALNGMVWKKIPKPTYVGREVFEMGVASAVICFNDGTLGILDVLRGCGVQPGKFAKAYCEQEDNERMRIMDYKAKESTKFSRKKLRNKRKGYQDANAEKEGDVYGPGLF